MRPETLVFTFVAGVGDEVKRRESADKLLARRALQLDIF